MKISQTVFELQSRHDFVTDRQTDGQTTQAKTICLPTLKGGDIIYKLRGLLKKSSRYRMILKHITLRDSMVVHQPNLWSFFVTFFQFIILVFYNLSCKCCWQYNSLPNYCTHNQRTIWSCITHLNAEATLKLLEAVPCIPGDHKVNLGSQFE